MPRFPSKNSIWSEKSKRLLFFSNALISFPGGYAQVVLPIYLKLIGITAVLVGVLTTISLLATSILLIPFGVLSDRYGRRVFLTLGGILAAASWGIMAFTTDLTFITISRALVGIGSALTSGPFNAALADVSSDEDRTKIFGFSSFVSQIASTGGALISGLPEVLQAGLQTDLISSYRPLFLLASLLSVGTAALMFLFKEKRIRKRKVEKFRFRSMKKISSFALTRGLIGFGAGLVIPLFSLWFYLRFGVGVSVLGPLFAISNVTLAFAYLASGKLAATIGSVNSLIICQGLAIVLLVAIPESPNYAIVSVLYVARNFLMNMSQPLETSFLMSIVEPEERASASAMAGTASSITRAVSPSLGGHFMSSVSLSLPFYLTAGLYATSTVLFYAFFKDVRIPGEATIRLRLRLPGR